jgi:hypothetical protein
LAERERDCRGVRGHSSDTRELAKHRVHSAPIGVYSNAVFDLAGASGGTREARYLLTRAFQRAGRIAHVRPQYPSQEDQPAHPKVMILSYGLWVRRFHPVALVSNRLLGNMLAGLESGHSESIWIAVSLVAVATALACWIPARRATRMDPTSALREE